MTSTSSRGRGVVMYMAVCVLLAVVVMSYVIDSSFQSRVLYMANQTATGEAGVLSNLHTGRLLQWRDYMFKPNDNLSLSTRLPMVSTGKQNVPKTFSHKIPTLNRSVPVDTVLATIPKPPISVLGNSLNAKKNDRQGSCDGCFKHDFNYIIDNPDICTHTSDQKVELVVFIFTIHQNIKARNSVRESWMSPYRGNKGNVRYAFLLGEIKDGKQREAVVKENNVYHDIIKEDFVDIYSNLTYKTIMGFKWTTQKCAHARYVMKTDDDMFVNIPKLLKTLSSVNENLIKSTIIGSCSKVANPIRNARSKWYASVKSYPDKQYPGFCSGTGYATSIDVARKVYEISPNVPFFHLEDVYTALCIKKLKFTLTATAGFHPSKPPGDGCTYKKNYITAHYISPELMLQLWKKSC